TKAVITSIQVNGRIKMYYFRRNERTFASGFFMLTHCSKPKKQKETFDSLDSSRFQSKSENNSFSVYPSELRPRVRKDDFDLDPDVLISDNFEEVKEILLDIKLSDQSRRDS